MLKKFLDLSTNSLKARTQTHMYSRTSEQLINYFPFQIFAANGGELQRLKYLPIARTTIPCTLSLY